MVRFSVRHPWVVTIAMVAVAGVLAAFAPGMRIDTDPENMLSADDPVRVLHDRMKETFTVHDMIVVGVVNDAHDDGVFNPRSLRKVYALTEFAAQLQGERLEPGAIDADAVLADAGLLEGAKRPQPGAGQTPPPGAAPEPPVPDRGGEPGLPEFGEPEPGLPAMGGNEPPLPGIGSGPEPALPELGAEPSSAVEGEQAAEPPAERAAEARGVVVVDLMAPSTVDRIEHGAGNTVRFSYLMSRPLPDTPEEALDVRDGGLANPLLRGTVVSDDGLAAAIYLPITHKDVSYKVASRIREFAERLGGPEQYHITGLPVAEDTFGHEMFVQMGQSAPMAMVVIFVLMLVFFRKPILIISPMIIAVVSVAITMGALVATGHTVHIMSSMIPIFIMPIAVLDAIHILSEFFDQYQRTRDRRATVLSVMDELFMPMLYTSLTSAAGFASLALAPIPPVQVFGIFVALGVMVAWVLTVTFVPAYVMFIPERRLAGFGVSHADEAPPTPLARLLRVLGRLAYGQRKLVVVCTVLLAGLAVYGITLIRINDNPTRWFVPGHPIRVADRVMNAHFAGTYQAYLAITPDTFEPRAAKCRTAVDQALGAMQADYAARLPDGPGLAAFARARELVREVGAHEEVVGAPSAAEALLARVMPLLEAERDAAPDDAYPTWTRAMSAIEAELAALRKAPLKRPDLLRWIHRLQEHLVAPDGPVEPPIVGKSSSVADIVRKVNRELSGSEAQNRVPDTAFGVANCLLQFQGSHTPDDLYHFVTPDYGRANLWLQLRSGDNADMETVVAQVDDFIGRNPAPVKLTHEWFGLTYINVVWQQKMVSGMLQAFLGSFLVVFLLMAVLFHSVLWGLLSMVPLTVTIALIYGMIGLVGKDYDMPVAVLSSLTLGLAVDFAIHFLARARAMVEEGGQWPDVAARMFGEPARAIARNAIVVAIGFTPLLAAPLMPYRTVGAFMAAILGVAAVGTLLILPALVQFLRRLLFAHVGSVRITCNCIACAVLSVAAVVLLALNFRSYFEMEWNTLTWMSLILIPLLVVTCGYLSRRRACRLLGEEAEARAAGTADAEPEGGDPS